MARRGDPAVRVIEFFETVPIAAAQQALALARRAVIRREIEEVPETAKPKRRKRRAKAAAGAGAEASSVGRTAATTGVSLRPGKKSARNVDEAAQD